MNPPELRERTIGWPITARGIRAPAGHAPGHPPQSKQHAHALREPNEARRQHAQATRTDERIILTGLARAKEDQARSSGDVQNARCDEG